VALSQVLIYLVYIKPLVGESNIVLDGSLWWLFIIDTVLIAAAGYVVNDIYDKDADILNKPNRQFIKEEGLSVRAGWIYYWLLVIVGFLVAYFIADQIDKIHLLVIYPIATVMLFLYSRSFKKMPLLGNLVVAAFCAFVPGIIMYAEWEVISNLKLYDPSSYTNFLNLFIAYIVFAFLSTMVREIIKDIEDIEGDSAENYKTLPIFTSKLMAKNISFFFGVLLLVSYSIWLGPYLSSALAMVIMPFAILMALLTIMILYLISKASEKDHFTQISKWLKILMIISLFIFLCIPLINQLIS